MKNLIVLILALTSVNAFAAAKTHSPMTSPGSSYGMAGCGLGSLVFKENDKSQILAATTNGTFGTQTFGITFGTSNCPENPTMASKEQVETFIAANQHSLQTDMARGNGETLNGLGHLMGAIDMNAFNTQMKSHYSQIFAQTNMSAKQVTENLYQVLN
jgi:hypothetical protein